eukprot:s4337_g3.t1
MADRRARSRSRDSLQADQRPQCRDVFLIVDLMHLMNYSADDVDRFQSLRCLRAGLRPDETVAAFSFFELIPYRRLGDFLVEDLAEKVCKRFESHTGVMLNPNEIELDVQTPESEGHASRWHLLLGRGTILNILDRLFPRELQAIFTDAKFIAASRLDDTDIFEILFDVPKFFRNVFGIELPVAGLELKLDHGPGFPINREQMNWSMLKLLDTHLSGWGRGFDDYRDVCRPAYQVRMSCHPNRLLFPDLDAYLNATSGLRQRGS